MGAHSSYQMVYKYIFFCCWTCKGLAEKKKPKILVRRKKKNNNNWIFSFFLWRPYIFRVFIFSWNVTQIKKKKNVLSFSLFSVVFIFCFNFFYFLSLFFTGGVYFVHYSQRCEKNYSLRHRPGFLSRGVVIIKFFVWDVFCFFIFDIKKKR